MLIFNGVFSMPYNDDFGYGKVSNNVYNTLKNISIKSDIEICLNIPPYSFTLPKSYKIGFTTLESTKIPDSWIKDIMEIDEIWTASNFNKQVYKQYTNKPIHVFNHGLDSDFLPIKRKQKTIKTLLFIGDELRSNEDLVVEAFNQLNISKDYRLIIKRKKPGKIIKVPGITTIEANYSKQDMINLFYLSDVLVYPTSGEGFGFVGLEAIGTGLPIIATTEWSEYKHLITIPIYSELSKSKWQEIHPGNMFNPSIENIKESIINWINNYESLINISYDNAIKAHNDFNWKKVNANIVKRLINIDKNLK